MKDLRTALPRRADARRARRIARQRSALSLRRRAHHRRCDVAHHRERGRVLIEHEEHRLDGPGPLERIDWRFLTACGVRSGERVQLGGGHPASLARWPYRAGFWGNHGCVLSASDSRASASFRWPRLGAACGDECCGRRLRSSVVGAEWACGVLADGASFSSSSISPRWLARAQNPKRRNNARAGRFSHSVVAVESVKPFSRARCPVRLASAVPTPMPCRSSATATATSVTPARSATCA